LIIAGLIALIGQGVLAYNNSSNAARTTIGSTIGLGAILLGLGIWKVMLDKKNRCKEKIEYTHSYLSLQFYDLVCAFLEYSKHPLDNRLGILGSYTPDLVGVLYIIRYRILFSSGNVIYCYVGIIIGRNTRSIWSNRKSWSYNDNNNYSDNHNVNYSITYAIACSYFYRAVYYSSNYWRRYLDVYKVKGKRRIKTRIKIKSSTYFSNLWNSIYFLF
jgi:hypothetical protein